MDLTVYHDGQFFVGIITHKEIGKLYGARYIFGMEPSDEEVLIFVNGPMLAYFQHVAKCGVEVKENNVQKYKTSHTTSRKRSKYKTIYKGTRGN